MARGRRSFWIVVQLAFALGLGSCSPSRSDTQERQVYVTLAPKGSVRTFYSRLASEQGQLVVTAHPVADGFMPSIPLTIREGEQLFIVEGDLPAAPLAGEVARVGAFALIRLPSGLNPHAKGALNRHDWYVEVVPRQEITAPVGVLEPEAVSLLTAIRSRIARSGKPSGSRSGAFDIAPEYLKQKLEEFSGALPTKIGDREVTISERRSKAGRDQARAWLRQEYERLGYSVSEHTYSGGANIIAERRGEVEPERYLIVSAHLDNVGNPGADDNGSGTISLLAIAQALKELPLRYSLRFVGFDQEETQSPWGGGLVGSTAYVNALHASQELDDLIGVINVEMTAYDSNDDGAVHIIDCSENTSSELSTLVTDVIRRDEISLHKIDACTNASDHASFWRYDRPAIVVSQNFFGGDANPCYHRSCDTVTGLNWSYMANITAALARVSADLVAN